MNWYKLAQQLDLFEYGDEVWPLSERDRAEKERQEDFEKRQQEYKELQKLRKERGSYYDPKEFKILTKSLINFSLRIAEKISEQNILDYKIIGSWFPKNNNGIKPKDFDILVSIENTDNIVGKKMLESETEFSGISVDLFFTDGKKSVVPVSISPQQVEYQIRKIRGV